MKKFFRIAAALSLTGLLLSGCGAGGSSDKNLTPLVLNEVAHSIFYAPQYAAIELGYFEEEGIDLTLVNGGGADKMCIRDRSSPASPEGAPRTLPCQSPWEEPPGNRVLNGRR